MSATPRITVGMPVYNGADTIRDAIEALLDQTCPDFELVVSDNASTDATESVVRELAERDSRIRYVRQPVNLGANGNYSYVARVARGEFLKWSAASDWCHPTFLERCLEALEAAPDAVLAAPRTMLFEQDRGEARPYAHDIEILGESPSERLRELDERLRLNNAFNGLIRLDALRRTPLVPAYRQADMVLMGHLALLGKMLLVDAPLYYRRMEPATSTALQDKAAVIRHHYPTPTFRSLFQAWKYHAGWYRAAVTAPMPPGERLSVLKFVTRHLVWDRRALAADLGGLWRYATRGGQ